MGGSSFARVAARTARQRPNRSKAAVERFVDDVRRPHRRHAARARGDPHHRRSRDERRAGRRRRCLPTSPTAYAALSEEADIRSDGPAGDPGSDREPFDANRAYRNARLSGPHAARRAAVLRRARPVGPALAAAPIVVLEDEGSRAHARRDGRLDACWSALMKAVPAGRNVRFHLMGHSFGCIVVAGMLNGPKGAGGLPAAGRFGHAGPGRHVALGILQCDSVGGQARILQEGSSNRDGQRARS